MANHYDKMLHKNLEKIFIAIAEKLSNISLVNAEEIPSAV